MRRRRQMNNNLFDYLKSGFPADPSTGFIQSRSGHITTYADMLARTAQYANALIGLGVSPGDRVAVQVEKSLEALECPMHDDGSDRPTFSQGRYLLAIHAKDFS